MNGLLLLLAKTVWLVCVVLSLLGEVTKIAELDVELSLSDAPSWLNRSMKVYLWSLKVGGLMVCPLVFAAPLVLVFPDLLSSPVRYVVVGLALIGSIPIMVGLVVALLMIPLVLFVAIPVGIVKARRRRREEALAYLEYLHRRPQ